jgi:Protein of unknown function (DUF3455)
LPSPQAHAKLSRAMRIHKSWSAMLPLFGFALCSSVFGEEFLPCPENSSIVVAVVADGAQIYESKPIPGGGFVWSLKAPEAELKSLSGEILGKHGAGPSWTFNDGSSVVGNVPPLKNLAAPQSIPWLSIAVKSKSGSGILDQVDYVMRVATEGGVAPTEPPKAEGETVKVRYHAIYLFLHKG